MKSARREHCVVELSGEPAIVFEYEGGAFFQADCFTIFLASNSVAEVSITSWTALQHIKADRLVVER